MITLILQKFTLSLLTYMIILNGKKFGVNIEQIKEK